MPESQSPLLFQAMGRRAPVPSAMVQAKGKSRKNAGRPRLGRDAQGNKIGRSMKQSQSRLTGSVFIPLLGTLSLLVAFGRNGNIKRAILHRDKVECRGDICKLIGVKP